MTHKMTTQQESGLRKRWDDKEFEFLQAQCDYEDVNSGYYGRPHRGQFEAIERYMQQEPELIFDKEPMRE